MTRHKLLSVLGFIGMVAAIPGLVATHSIFARHPACILFQILAVLLMIWPRLTFGFRSFHLSANPISGGLVTNGPYRFLRHPIYAAVLLFIFSAIASSFSIQNVAFGLLGTAGALARGSMEEELLRREFAEYTAYARQTKRLIPFIF